jgi:O-antigen/teichoic acid export membrane protein
MAQGGWLTVGSGAVQLGSLLAAVVVGRELGRAPLGRYATTLAIGSVVVRGAGSGVPAMTLRDAAAGRVGRLYVGRAVRSEFLVTAVATGVAATVVAGVVGGAGGVELGLLSGLANMALAQLGLATAIAIGLQRHLLVVVAQGLLGLTLPVLTLLAVRADWGVRGALLSQLVAAAAAASMVFWRQRRQIRTLAEGVESKGLLWRSRSFLGLGLLNTGYERADSVVLLSVAGASAAGVYAAAYRFLGPFNLLGNGFGQVFFPRLSRIGAGTDEWRRMRRRGRRLYGLAIIPPALVAAAVMPLLLVAIFGPSFRSAVTPARILMLSVVPRALYWPEALGMLSSGNEATVLYLFLCSTVFDVALVAALAGPLGPAGTAWAWVATELLLLAGIQGVVHLRGHGAPPESS